MQDGAVKLRRAGEKEKIDEKGKTRENHYHDKTNGRGRSGPEASLHALKDE